MNQMKRRQTYKWVEGTVDTEKEHIKITYGEDPATVALVAPGEGRTFVVQFVLGPGLFISAKQVQHIKEEVRKELDFYLVQKCEPNPWAYAIYHCNTGANVYSSVHWGYYRDGDKGECYKSEVIVEDGKKLILKRG